MKIYSVKTDFYREVPYILPTIVIFARIRENRKKKHGKLEDIVNESITQKLTRSIYTSITTFNMVTALYIFGVSSIREFVSPLMAGVICGAYFSLCII